MANTTNTLARWQAGDPLTAAALNRQIDAINFLLKTVGGILERISLAQFDPSDPGNAVPGIVDSIYTDASVVSPRIEEGTLKLPPASGLSGAVWDASITAPQITDGILHLNPAADLQPGYVDAISFDATEGSPSLQNGSIHLPAAGDNNPGFISAVEYVETAASPTLSAGKIQLPPASYTKDGTSSEPLSYPGFISSVKFSSEEEQTNLPRIENGNILLPEYPAALDQVYYDDTRNAPEIVDGVLYLNPADFDPSGSSPSYSGYISSVEYSSSGSAPCIEKGSVLLPPADYLPSDASRPSSPGHVQSIQYDENATAPYIDRGDIYINPANYQPGDESIPASPGYVSGIEMATAADASNLPRIENGKIIIPPNTCNLAFDNHDFALIEQEGLYVVTLQQWVQDGWNETFYTPLPPSIKGSPVQPTGTPTYAEAHYSDASSTCSHT